MDRDAFYFLSVLSMALMLLYMKRKKVSWLVSSAIVSSPVLAYQVYWNYYNCIVGNCFVYIRKTLYGKTKKPLRMVFSHVSDGPLGFKKLSLAGTLTGGRQPGEYTIDDNIELSLRFLTNGFHLKFPKLCMCPWHFFFY